MPSIVNIYELKKQVSGSVPVKSIPESPETIGGKLSEISPSFVVRGMGTDATVTEENQKIFFLSQV